MKIISPELWIEIEKLFPLKTSKVGRPEKDRKQKLFGILYILKNGLLWHSLPEKYGRTSTVLGKFMKWCRLGIFQKILKVARNYYFKSHKNRDWYDLILFQKKHSWQNLVALIQQLEQKKGAKQSILVDQELLRILKFLQQIFMILNC